MASHFMKTSVALLFVCSAAPASALGMWLVATSNTVDVAVGDSITLDVMMDFSAEPTLGGGFDITYDVDQLALTGFTNNDIGGFSNRDPDVLPGLLASWAFGDFGGLGGPLVVGSVAFAVVGSPGPGAIDLRQAQGGVEDNFFSAVTLSPYLPGQVTFQGLNYSVAAPVPVPAAAWLLLSGLAVLVGGGRRQRVLTH